MKLKDLPKLLRPKEVAKYLRISSFTVNRMVKKGILKCTRINTRGDRIFKKEDLIKFLKNRKEC